MSDNETITDNSNIDNSVQDATIRDIISNIEYLTNDYTTNNNIDDIRTISQQEYNAILIYICMSYIKPKKVLYKYTQGISNNNQITCMYDDYIVSNICQYYIYMCSRYNKIINQFGFSLLTGIELDTLHRWESLESQRPQAYGTSKTLKIFYENSLENGAQSGKNPVGFIATLNHRFGWSSDNRPSLTVNITRSKSEILSSINPDLLTDNS